MSKLRLDDATKRTLKFEQQCNPEDSKKAAEDICFCSGINSDEQTNLNFSNERC